MDYMEYKGSVEYITINNFINRAVQNELAQDLTY